MTASALSRGPIGQSGVAMPAMMPLRQACAVRLIDRRTGQTHRINGRPLVLFTKAPEDAVAELLAGRDATVWEARVEPMGAPTTGGGA